MERLVSHRHKLQFSPSSHCHRFFLHLQGQYPALGKLQTKKLPLPLHPSYKCYPVLSFCSTSTTITTPTTVAAAASPARLHLRQNFRLLSAKVEAEMASKIQLYSLATPNGMKIGIALEEMGLEYDAHVINILKNDNFTPEFIAVNPNSKIPAIVDPDGPDGKPFNVFESGAILLYLADKTGKFLSHDPRLKWETTQWLFFQMAGVGPMFGQFNHFFRFAKEKCKDPYPVERYATESKRLLGVLEKRLEGREYLIDDGYSIADMATVPWVYSASNHPETKAKLEIDSLPNVTAWVQRCITRPATAKGMTVCKLS
ncbi:hypothetical protein BDL97_14G086400 [Sphagnum fallax]|nr:hypothetical protein BDL97_14G086400 [Sphagnum fallax]